MQDSISGIRSIYPGYSYSNFISDVSSWFFCSTLCVCVCVCVCVNKTKGAIDLLDHQLFQLINTSNSCGPNVVFTAVSTVTSLAPRCCMMPSQSMLHVKPSSLNQAKRKQCKYRNPTMRNASHSCTSKKTFVVMALRKNVTLCERSLQVVTTILQRTTPHFWHFEATRVLRVSTVKYHSQLSAPPSEFSITFETKEIGCFLPIALRKRNDTFSFLFHKRGIHSSQFQTAKKTYNAPTFCFRGNVFKTWELARAQNDRAQNSRTLFGSEF